MIFDDQFPTNIETFEHDAINDPIAYSSTNNEVSILSFIKDLVYIIYSLYCLLVHSLYAVYIFSNHGIILKTKVKALYFLLSQKENVTYIDLLSNSALKKKKTRLTEISEAPPP